MLRYTSAVVIGLLGLSLGGCSFSNYDRDLSQQASYNADANDTRSTYIVYRTEQLIKSCDMKVNDQITASESVMELIVTEGVDRTTGQMKIDLDENVYNAGIRLLTSVSYTHLTLPTTPYV